MNTLQREQLKAHVKVQLLLTDGSSRDNRSET